MKFKLTTVTGAQHNRSVRSVCLLALALASAVPSFAATLTVTNTNDSGAGSLRQTIADASSGDTINFNLPKPSTITLTSGLLEIGKSLNITGPGQTQLAIDGNHQFTIFLIDQGASVSLAGLTIQHGQGSQFLAGGCLNRICYYAGGIENDGVALTLTAVTVSGNSTPRVGGGINSLSSGPLTITDSTISGNSALGGVPAEGGGIEGAGTLTITNSTISGNSAEDGGGIDFYTTAGSSSIINSTISGNTATLSLGGGVEHDGGPLTLVNTTITGNSGAVGGGGVFVSSYLASVTTKGTLLANNVGGNCLATYTNLAQSVFTSQGYNLSDDSTCARFTEPTDKNNTPAQLDTNGLKNNGGATQTVALLPTSPAVDAIPAANCTDTNGKPVTTDQRGTTRPQGKGCDIGAYELAQVVPFASFHPSLAIDNGKHPGFVLTSIFTLGSGTSGLNPATEAMTLQIANYTLALPAGSFHQLWTGSNAPYAYEGTVNGTKVVLGLASLGNNTFTFDAAGAPGSFSGVKNPVTITLTFGSDSGTTPVTAVIKTY